MVLVVVAIAVGVAVVTVPAMGRGNAGIPRTHIHKEERKGGRARETREKERKKERKKERDSHITPNTPFIEVVLGVVLAAACENARNLR